MRKTAILLVACACIACGCGRRSSEVATGPEERARLLIGRLTNATPKNIIATEAVRTNLLSMADAEARQKLLADWTRSLLCLDISQMDPPEVVDKLVAAGRVLDDAVLWCMQDLGASYEDCWKVRFEQIERLGNAINRIEPIQDQSAKSMRDEMIRWQAYRALVEYRERLFEKHECCDLYRRDVTVSDCQYKTVQSRLEKLMGRSVRPESEILHLGKFTKLAGEKVKEREKIALERWRRTKRSVK